MTRRTTAKWALAAAIALQLAAMPSAQAVLSRPLLTRTVQRTTSKTWSDMEPGSCLYEGGHDYLCMGKDGHSYGCSTATNLCVPLS